MKGGVKGDDEIRGSATAATGSATFPLTVHTPPKPTAALLILSLRPKMGSMRLTKVKAGAKNANCSPSSLMS